MNRIQSLKINNFKFFRDENPIEFNDNNLLLYGENGSGKSSIYWSLYTLFEASLKSDDNDIKKYFSKIIKIDDNLINIHALENPIGSDDYNSYIELITTDSPSKTFRISKNDTVINTSIDAKQTNYASDFINYRMLSSISAFRHSDKIDLFWVFVADIFKYVQFPRVQITRNGVLKQITNAAEIWQEIEQGHEVVDSVNSTNPKKIKAYKGSNEYKEFDALVNSFNDSLKKLIDYINVQAPNFFQKLGYTFPFYLSLEKEAGYYKGKTVYEPVPFVLRIIIPEYDTQTQSVYKPHSFLNEAKLSAIAISIRLAILSSKRLENCLKFIVLDDLLISLDMKNREKVLELLMSDEFVNNYQLIILTHDKMFYQMAKYKISLLEQENWVYYELHEKKDGLTTRPDIKKNRSYVEKAEDFLNENQLDESANNLRKAAEAFCKKFLSKTDTITEDYSSLDLNGMIVKCKNFALINEINEAPFEELDKYRKFFLNSSSHDDIDNAKFKTEIEECLNLFKTYFELLKIRNVLAVGTKLYFEMNDKKTSKPFRFDIIIDENTKLYKEVGSDSVLLRGKTIYNILQGHTIIKENQAKHQSLKVFYENVFSTSDQSSNPDFWEGIKFTDTGLPLNSIRLF